MYAVIRTGGKQYRVAPGDVIRVEKLASGEGQGESVQFKDVLAVSASEGEVGRPSGETLVTGRVLGEGRGDKVLVFHYKRKKQYKKLQGHRQPFTAVEITEISVDGQKFTFDGSRPYFIPGAKRAAEPAAAPASKKSRKAAAHAGETEAAVEKAERKAAPTARASSAAKKGAAKKKAAKPTSQAKKK
ncbi:MAG TPA: 50S ribosomal protein L21 [Terriglobales bacterium]|nr:50S ribosomal protein L21 [Terriglobales bacterium]